MLRDRRYAVRSKATPSTVCQKCLKRDIYECKTEAQERPYVPRPSRTQQLFNPKLVPKLPSDTPNELANKKGTADEILANSARGRKRSRSHSTSSDQLMGSPHHKRSRSISTSSSTSVSTISTRSSRSPTPRRRSRQEQDTYLTSQQNDDMSFPTSRPRATVASKGAGRKRRHRSSSGSENAYDNSNRHRAARESSKDSSRGDRNIRRRRNSRSPVHRGRQRSWSPSSRRRNSSVDNWQTRRRRDEALRFREDGEGPERSRSPSRKRGGAPVEGKPKTSSRQKEAKERSLSPYSRRLMLTAAMSKGG